MVLTLDGMETLSKVLLLKKAFLPISVTFLPLIDDGIETFAALPVYLLMLTVPSLRTVYL